MDRGARRRARLRIPRDRFCRAFPSVDRYAWYWVTGRADRDPLCSRLRLATAGVIESSSRFDAAALPSVGDPAA